MAKVWPSHGYGQAMGKPRLGHVIVVFAMTLSVYLMALSGEPLPMQTSVTGRPPRPSGPTGGRFP